MFKEITLRQPGRQSVNFYRNEQGQKVFTERNCTLRLTCK